MNYHNITKEDMNNGDGLRVVLWTAGCSHHCKGCQNPQTWDPEGGIPFDDEAFEELRNELSKDYVSGITFSGGDPLFCDNRSAIEHLIRTIRKEFGDTKTIWLWTGFLWEDIKELPFINLIDIIVDGPFILEQRDVSLKWKGSPNQRVIDVKNSLIKGEVVLHCDDKKDNEFVSEQLFDANAASCCDD